MLSILRGSIGNLYNSQFMRILTSWLREYVPALPVDDLQLADDLTLRGIAVEGVSHLSPAPGHVFEMDITTNRVDAMNHYGVAREAATIYNVALQPLAPALPAATTSTTPAPRIRIEAPELCGRFTARILRGISVEPTTGTIAARFAALDFKAISNAVDASNYVLHAMGQPTHAFDLDKIRGAVVVRLARKGEKLVTLDGVERTLAEDDLVIADDERAISLAGVMGGLETSITSATKNVLIEAAWFDPAAIRRSSRRHGLHTDASHRFERGADFAAPPVASAMVAEIILRDGGSLDGELLDVKFPEAEARTVARPPIPLRIKRVAGLLGATENNQPLDSPTVVPILTALGCELSETSPGTYQAKLPGWRLDLEREIDLIEEVARVFGYNRFRNTLPAFSGTVLPLPGAEQLTAVRTTLLAAGFSEAISSTFCSRADAELFAAQASTEVELGNPLSEEAGCLRPSLLPGMLAMLAHNLNHGAGDARLFETGAIFTGDAAAHYPRVIEAPALAIGLTGTAAATALHAQPSAAFFTLKGVVESVLRRFDCRSLYFDAFPQTPDLQPKWLHTYRAARVTADGMTLGWLGELHPAEAERRKLRQPVYICEIALDRLFHAPLRTPAAEDISRFPAVERDFSFVLPDAVSWQRIADALTAAAIPHMQHFAPQEIFRDAKGASVPKGHSALLVRAVFQSPEATLREEELQQASEQLVSAVTQLGGTLRA